VFKSRKNGEIAGDNPWNAGTLEWGTTSPPPNYNFNVIPSVASRYPLWEPLPDDPAYKANIEMAERDRFGLLAHRRETLGTSWLDAVPVQRIHLPGPTIIPFLAALAVAFTFIGFIFDVIFVPIGALLFFVAGVAWHWPAGMNGRHGRRRTYAKVCPPAQSPPLMGSDPLSIGVWQC
jgi:cytochrome c oxidase subunit I+III